jgi:hypothetical protein
MRVVLTASGAVTLALVLAVGTGNAGERRAANGIQPARDALITGCYEMAGRVVPRGRGRLAWVVRHAD